MTREEIEREYIIKHNIIISPGKFESEPRYAPYFYDLLLNGEGEEELIDPDYSDETATSFSISQEDIEQFPELLEYSEIILFISDSGFVYTNVIPASAVVE
jgi:hypothetical protein